MIPPLATNTIAKLKLSMPINGMFVPFKSCATALRRYCAPALFHSDDAVFDIGPSGSSLFLRYRGRNFAICTQHQLRAGTAKPEDFMLLIEEPDGKKVGLSPNKITRVTFEHEEHENLGDVFLAEYDNARGDRNLRWHFLQLDMSVTLSSVPADQVRAIFAIGYPTMARDAEIIFDADDIPTTVDITSRWVKLYLELAEPALLDTENRRALVKHRTYEQELENPDGLSGAPVFFVYLDPSLQAHLGFAGMITHGNGTRFMIYEGETIRLLLERCSAEEDLASQRAAPHTS